MLSIKDLVFKKQPTRKLVDQYVGSYEIEEVASTNIVKIADNRLNFYFYFYFIFIFILFYFIFLFLEQLGLGVISHAVTSVTT